MVSREYISVSSPPDYTFEPRANISKEEMVEILRLLIDLKVDIKIPSNFKAQVEGLSQDARRHIIP